MGSVKFISILILLFLIIPLLGAQENVPDPEKEKTTRRVCIFDIYRVKGEKDDSSNAVFTEAIKSNLVFELTSAGFEIIDDKEWKEIKTSKSYSNEDLLEGDKAIQIAELLKADVVINGFLTITNNRILFGIKSYDVKSRRLAVSTLKSGRAGASATNLINEAVAEIIPIIRESMESYSTGNGKIEKEVLVFEDVSYKEMIAKGFNIHISLKSKDEEASVYLADTFVGKIDQGEISVDAQASSRIIVKVEKAGFHTGVYTYKLGEEDMEIKLPPLAKKTRSGLEFQYTLFQTLGIGAGYRYFINPDWFYISAVDYLYLQHGYLPGSDSLIHNDINLSVGHYIYFQPSSLFRGAIFTGFGFVLSMFTIPDMPLGFDPYWEILGGWLELNFKHFSTYFKFAGVYYQDIFGTGLIGTGWSRPIPVALSIGAVWKW